MKITYLLFLALVLLASCGDTGIEPIDHYILVHDNSSKVWLIDKQLDGDKDYTPLQLEYKEIIVFHESRNAYFYRLNTLGKKPGIKKSFWLDEAKNEFGFKGAKKDLVFEIVRLTRTKIILKPKNNSFKYTVELIPFPEY
jgi:alanine-alpha-ketoisovalerate/valine-pyruvate aminotransferase